MKERNLRILIPLMTAAMLGLIVIQLYLIVTQYKFEEERFNRTVNDALLRFSALLEKEEAAKIFLKKVSEPLIQDVIVFKNHVPNEEFPVLKSDSAKNLEFYQIAATSKNSKVQFHFEFRDSFPKKTIRINTSRFDSSKKFSTRKAVKDTNIGMHKFVGRSVFIDGKNDSVFFQKDKLVKNVVSELIYVESAKKIEDRVSKERIEKMLSKELRNSGIENNFKFGVKKSNENKFVISNYAADTLNLKNSNLRTTLFPSEMLGDKYSISVFFPDKQKSILTSLSGMLGLLVLFITVIIAVFYKTVQMFIKQKKITEIKNDLINNITHEFKTPISTISLACQALNEPSLSTNQVSIVRYSKIINEENDRLRMMVDTLLNTAAMEKSEFKLRIEKVDFAEIVNDAASKFNEAIKQKNGSIVQNNMIEDPFMNGDKFHLNNFIANLIDNAIKYNSDNPAIQIFLKDDSDNIYFTISDNGIGIPKEHLDNIFESFFRVQTGNIQDVRGNGIGLNYTKNIINAHQGKIQVISEVGKGTSFEIVLPRNFNE